MASILTEERPAADAAAYEPAPVRKRRAASVVTAGVAALAGVALAATLFSVYQDGSGSFDAADADPRIEEGDISVSPLDLGALPVGSSGLDPEGAAACLGGDTPENCRPHWDAATAPEETQASSFTITNANSEARGEVLLQGITFKGGDQALYDSTWVRITREDPTGLGGDDKVVYHGPLGMIGQYFTDPDGIYMGDVCTGATQTFDVLAWVTQGSATDAAFDFTVDYGVRPSPQPVGSC